MFPMQSNTKLEDFEWNDFLEKGAYGQVHRVTDKYGGRVFAIKKINKHKIKQQNMLGQIWTEISIMYQINHRNIVRMFDHFESEHHLCLVMEYVEKGSLLQLLAKSKHLSELRTKAILKDIISAVEYLHKRTPPIIHRDIKPQNILIDVQDNAKLADFGWSNYSNYLRVTYCGTESYLAPEMIGKSGHDEKLDYWCLGVLAYELLTGLSPFDTNIKDIDRRKKLHQNILSLNYELPEILSEAAKSFIKGLLQLDPNKRMNIEQMKQHPFLSDKMMFMKHKEIAEMPTEDDQVAFHPKGGSTISELEYKRRENQMVKRLNEKLRGAESTISALTQRAHYLQAEVKRLSEQLQEEAIRADEQAELLVERDFQIKVLKETVEKYKAAEATYLQASKANRQLMAELASLREEQELQEQRIDMLSQQLRLQKQSSDELQARYLKLFEQHQQLRSQQPTNPGRQRKSIEDEPFKGLLRTNLQQLKRAFAQSQQADSSISKQLKYQKLMQQIAMLKELECERQREMELLAESYETKKCELVNLHNLEIQRLRFELRSVEEEKRHDELLIDLLLLNNSR